MHPNKCILSKKTHNVAWLEKVVDKALWLTSWPGP